MWVPGAVKVTIRLMKWWREQQEWECELTRPSDELLELIALHDARQGEWFGSFLYDFIGRAA